MRVSPHVYNDEADVDRFVAAMTRRDRLERPFVLPVKLLLECRVAPGEGAAGGDMLTRRTWLAASGSLSARRSRAARPRFAQDYPSKPVRVIVPYAAGGATDTLARLVATRIDQELKQSIVVDNRGGGASQVGTQAVATAPPDGYTIGMIDIGVHDQSRPVRRQAALRHAQGFRADLADRDRAAGVRGAPFGRGEERAGSWSRSRSRNPA